MVESSPVGSADRPVRALDSYSAERAAWPLAKLCAQLDLLKSTLHHSLISPDNHDILRLRPSPAPLGQVSRPTPVGTSPVGIIDSARSGIWPE